MISCKKGVCGYRPTIDGTRIDVEQILCALFCGESKDDILEIYPQISEKDFEDALTFSMYAVSKFDRCKNLAWDKNSSENKWV